MDFTYPPEAEAFRTEFRAWLDEHLTDEIRAGAGWSMELGADGLERLRAVEPHPRRRALRGDRVARRVGRPRRRPHGAGRVRRGDAPRGAPGTLNPLGLSNIAPAIIEHGTDEQKRTLLPRMLRGDDIWCQGFSEPNAGSDLASLRTTAVRDGDCWIVNGQKTWNTLGHMANWCELLVRTDPGSAEAQGHQLPARRHDAARRRGAAAHHDHRRGRVQRDLLHRRARARRPDARAGERRLAGRDDDARVRARARSRSCTSGCGRRSAACSRSRETPGRGGAMAADDPVLRQKLARVYLEAELLKLISDRAISAELHGRAMGPGGQHRQAGVERGRAAPHRGRVRRARTRRALGPVGARSRLLTRAHHRRGHHAGEQEHPRPADPRSPPHLSPVTRRRAPGGSRCRDRPARPR